MKIEIESLNEMVINILLIFLNYKLYQIGKISDNLNQNEKNQKEVFSTCKTYLQKEIKNLNKKKKFVEAVSFSLPKK